MNPTNSSDALKQMQDFSSSRKSLSDLYSGAEQETGVNDARTRAQQLKQAASATEGLIRNVDPSVTGRLQGGMATEAQRQRLIALETQPLTEMYRTQTGAYDTASGEYSDAAARADKLASMRYGADTEKFNTLKSLYDTLNAQEQAAEEKRRWEAQQAENVRQFNEQMAQTRRASAGTNFSPTLGSLFSGGKSSSTPGSPANVPAGMQSLFNQVFIKPGGGKWGDQELVSDYNATLKSANYGNMRDKQKLELYHLVRPDIFGTSVPAAAMGNGGKLTY